MIVCWNLCMLVAVSSTSLSTYEFWRWQEDCSYQFCCSCFILKIFLLVFWNHLSCCPLPYPRLACPFSKYDASLPKKLYITQNHFPEIAKWEINFCPLCRYPAINKPAGVVHWLKHSKDAKNVDWVLILDADMIIRGPILPWELGAEKGKPVAAYYGYSLISLVFFYS